MQEIAIRSNGSPEGESFVRQWHEAGRRQREAEAQWIATLRAKGIKAAHPDDGWVNNEAKFSHRPICPPYTVQFVYPQFFDNPQPGDRVALGWPGQYRVVRLTGYQDHSFGTHRWRVWSFEEEP